MLGMVCAIYIGVHETIKKKFLRIAVTSTVCNLRREGEKGHGQFWAINIDTAGSDHCIRTGDQKNVRSAPAGSSDRILYD